MSAQAYMSVSAMYYTVLAFVAVLATRFLTALRLKDMKGKLDGIKPANSIAIPDERQQVLEAAEEVS